MPEVDASDLDENGDGCLDDDGDGVLNPQDDCLNRGREESRNRLQRSPTRKLDEDSDGVSDFEDVLRTASNTVVDAVAAWRW